MLLRNDRQAALNQVESLCFETADGYASAAGQASDPGLARLFAGLAQQRRQLAAELATHIRTLDDLPQQPDPDKEAVAHVLAGIKAWLAGDAALLDDRERVEDRLADAVRGALGQDLPPDTLALLQQVLAHVDTVKHGLKTARS